LIAYFISNISAKNIKIHSRAPKLQQAKGGTFFETRCIYHGVPALPNMQWRPGGSDAKEIVFRRSRLRVQL